MYCKYSKSSGPSDRVAEYEVVVPEVEFVEFLARVHSTHPKFVTEAQALAKSFGEFKVQLCFDRSARTVCRALLAEKRNSHFRTNLCSSNAIKLKIKTFCTKVADRALTLPAQKQLSLFAARWQKHPVSCTLFDKSWMYHIIIELCSPIESAHTVKNNSI